MNGKATNDDLTAKADAAFRLAMRDVIEIARRTGTPIIGWENGQVVERSPDEVEQRLNRQSQ